MKIQLPGTYLLALRGYPGASPLRSHHALVMQEKPVQVIEALDHTPYATPAERARHFGGTDRTKTTWEAVTEENLERLLSRHTGPGDVPAPTKAAYAEFLADLRAGKRLYQYRLVYRRPGPAPAEPRRRRHGYDALIVGPYTLAYSLDLSRTIVEEALLAEDVDILLARRSGRVDQFVVINERFEAWLQAHTRWVAGAYIRSCSWFTRDDVAQAVEEGEVIGRPLVYAAGEPPGEHALDDMEIYTDATWVRWVAERHPEDQRRRLLRNQVLRLN